MSSQESDLQKKIFAKNLQRELDFNGKNQTDLANFLGVSSATTSDWINGKKYPRMEKINAMAEWFGITKAGLVDEPSNDELLSMSDDLFKALPSNYKMQCSLSEGEVCVLRLYNKLDETDKIKVLERIQTLLDDTKYNPIEKWAEDIDYGKEKA